MSRKGDSVVIVGAGQGGVQVACSLREEGFDGPIRLIGEERCSPYQRPPLSKGFLSGALDASELELETPEFFRQADIDFIAGERAVAINRAGRQLTLASGSALDYGQLVIATGSRNRSLLCLARRIEGVLSLRSLDDATALKARLAAKRVVVIGAGFLGLESAAVAAELGATVHVVEAVDRVMERAISPASSQAFRRRHEANGVRFSFNSLVVAVHDLNGVVSEVELSDGTRLPADLVLVAVGVVPNTELAEAAGLEVRNGIVVNEMLCTADEAVSAIGDCAAFPYAFDDGNFVRLESVQNAVDQARCVAQRLAGKPVRYDQLPTFWSDQAGLRLQIAGLARGDDTAVVRGDPESGQFSVFRFRQARLVCIESVNRPVDHMTGRKLLIQKITPTPEQAADLSFDLRQLVKPAVAKEAI